MSSQDDLDPLLPAALLDDVKALAALENRSTHEVLREAVERFVQDRLRQGRVESGVVTSTPRTPQQAAARMLERRRSHTLPEGTSIRDLMIHGRA